MRLFGRVRELEEQNRDLNRRLESVEEYIYRQDVFKLLEKYSKKYGIKIELFQNPYTELYYLAKSDGDVIYELPRREDMAGIYNEMHNVEDKIKAFLYDRVKEEKTDDKE